MTDSDHHFPGNKSSPEGRWRGGIRSYTKSRTNQARGPLLSHPPWPRWADARSRPAQRAEWYVQPLATRYAGVDHHSPNMGDGGGLQRWRAPTTLFEASRSRKVVGTGHRSGEQDRGAAGPNPVSPKGATAAHVGGLPDACHPIALPEGWHAASRGKSGHARRAKVAALTQGDRATPARDGWRSIATRRHPRPPATFFSSSLHRRGSRALGQPATR